MSDVMPDEADTVEALSEFDILMPGGKAARPGPAGSQGRLSVYEGVPQY